MSTSECDEKSQLIQSCYTCFIFVFLFFILFPAFSLSSKIFFHFLTVLNKRSKSHLLHAIVKIKSILPPETIIRVTKVLAYANTSSVTTNFHNELCDLPQKEKRYSICCLQINSFNSERFLRNTERTQTEIKKNSNNCTPDNFVDTETTICNTNVV